MSDAHMFEDAATALNYIMSGKAIFTIVSKKTGQRFTYLVERSSQDKKDDRPDIGFRFVKLLNGPDNTRSFQYMGIIRGQVYEHGRKSKLSEAAPSVIALNWVIQSLVRGEIRADQLEIWHEGRCGKCGKRLTVPASIATGLGPECVKSAFRCV